MNLHHLNCHTALRYVTDLANGRWYCPVSSLELLSPDAYEAAVRGLYDPSGPWSARDHNWPRLLDVKQITWLYPDGSDGAVRENAPEIIEELLTWSGENCAVAFDFLNFTTLTEAGLERARKRRAHDEGRLRSVSKELQKLVAHHQEMVGGNPAWVNDISRLIAEHPEVAEQLLRTFMEGLQRATIGILRQGKQFAGAKFEVGFQPTQPSPQIMLSTLPHSKALPRAGDHND
jgi:hypothetical protein